MNIPLSRPDIGEAEIEAVVDVLRGSQLSLGPRMLAFESAMAAYAGVPHAIAVSSGTAGLHLALLALGVAPGDEVIVPSFTFIAVANAVRYVGAVPVFVDIDTHTLNVDPALVEAAVTARTRALIVVHTFGYPAPLDALLAIARRHHLRVIEDACEALGSALNGQPVGSFADIGVFAFYPNKQISTGEGGMIVTRDPDLAAHMRALRNQGRYDTDDWLQHSILGYNYRLSEMQCALGCVQMERLHEILGKRAAVADAYRERLSSCPYLELPPQPAPDMQLGWFVFIVRLTASATPHRDTIVHRLREAGIQTGRYFAPIHLQPAYAAQTVPASLPITESVGRSTIALPFFSAMSRDEIDFVCASLRSSLDAVQALPAGA